jgi:hypothetical protein
LGVVSLVSGEGGAGEVDSTGALGVIVSSELGGDCAKADVESTTARLAAIATRFRDMNESPRPVPILLIWRSKSKVFVDAYAP